MNAINPCIIANLKKVSVVMNMVCFCFKCPALLSYFKNFEFCFCCSKTGYWKIYFYSWSNKQIIHDSTTTVKIIVLTLRTYK